jgi:predicted ATPase
MILLAPLDRQQARDMVSELAARHTLSNEMVEGVTERTGGVPLFVEEVTRLLLERGEQGGIQAIPPTLQQSLTARLDRLGSAREVAQVGAVIGRDFSYKLLREIAGIGDAPLQAALEKLADADILLVQGLPPASDYRFKHALIQDAAYENLLKSRRQGLHRRTAEVLRDHFADTAAAEPALLAHHFTQAGLTEAAIEWWRTAGQRSLTRSALLEGVEQLKRALAQIATLPATPVLRRAEIKLEVAFANATTLSGDLVNGKEHYDRALAIYDPAEHGPLTTRSGRDVGVALLASRSSCLWQLGYPETSCNDGEHAVKNAREIGDAATLMFALYAACFNHFYCGNYPAANTLIDELIALAEEKGASYWKALGTAVRGWLFALTGKASDAVQAITSGLSSLRSTNATLYEPWHLQQLAMAYAELGQPDDARRCVDDAIETIERSKEKWGEAEVHRIAGEIALKSLMPDPEKAKAYFERALAVARQQQAKSWELRAAMSLARLWRDQGKAGEARELLAPVYGWFTEGFDTRDLKEAKALLEELAS